MRDPAATHQHGTVSMSTIPVLYDNFVDITQAALPLPIGDNHLDIPLLTTISEDLAVTRNIPGTHTS